MTDPPDRSAVPVRGLEAMADAAEMLWVVLANVSGGDWTQQTPEWREAAARWRDNYFALLSSRRAEPEPSFGTLARHCTDEGLSTTTWTGAQAMRSFKEGWIAALSAAPPARPSLQVQIGTATVPSGAPSAPSGAPDWMAAAPPARPEPRAPHVNCPRCKGTGECDNAQFSCICRWHHPGCAILTLAEDCNCGHLTAASPSLPETAASSREPERLQRLATEIVTFLRSDALDGGTNLTTEEAVDRLVDVYFPEYLTAQPIAASVSADEWSCKQLWTFVEQHGEPEHVETLRALFTQLRQVK